MKTAQFFKILRDYAELARRTRKDYSELVDGAAQKHKDWLAAQSVDQSAKIALVDATVAREYDPAFRTYPKP